MRPIANRWIGLFFVSSTPNQLHIFDPIAHSDQAIALSAAPLNLSLSPDGKRACGCGRRRRDHHVDVLDIPDLKFNPIGSRGIGEIGITGAAAAVANAIYNATGKRVREYPITPDKLMQT